MKQNADFSELARNGVILWRLSKQGQADMWCLVFEVESTFSIVLDDNPMGTQPYQLTETHTSIVGSIHRAEALKGSMVQGGWSEVDVE